MTTFSLTSLQLAIAVLVAGNASAQTAAPPADTTMPELTVLGSAPRGYGVASSSSASKTDTLLRDTPQAITVLSHELIQDQAMHSMVEVIRYVPGIASAQGEGNRDAAVFRGNNSTSDFYVDGVRDDVQYLRDVYDSERIEALKGSNAMIFGRGGSGGVINRVTKQPIWNTVRQGALTLGAWGQRRATMDVGQPVSDALAVRVNALLERSDSYRRGVSAERAGVHPTLAMRAGADTSVVLGYEYFHDERVADRGVTSRDGRPLDTDPSAFFGNAELSTTWTRMHALTALVEHEWANGMTLRNRSRYAAYDKFYQNVYAASVVRADGTLDIGGYNNATERRNLFNQTDLSYTVSSGAVRHTLLAGVELGRQETDNVRNTAYNADNQTASSVPLSAPYVTGPLRFRPSASDANNTGVATVASLYVQDQLALSPAWQAVLGLRYDRFHVNFHNRRDGSSVALTDTPLSPRAGLVYKPVEAMSLYGSYSIAYQPRAGEQLASLTPANAAFDPEQFRNLELGVKWDVRPDLALTAAAYRLTRSNVVIAGTDGSSTAALVDGQVSKGLELGLSGDINRAWRVMGGYAYQDAQLTATQSATARDGARLAQVPKHTLSLWNRVQWSPSWAGALGLVYRASIYSSTSNAVTLAPFTRVDGALFYTVSRQYRVQFNVENLFDRRYFALANSDTNITPGAPRSIKATLHVSY